MIEKQEEEFEQSTQCRQLQKEVRDFIHLCEVCDVMYHISDECDELINDEIATPRTEDIYKPSKVSYRLIGTKRLL